MTITMKQQELNTDYYFTSDLAIATALSLWQPIEEINKSNPRKAVFVFKRNKQLNELVEAYFRNELTISPQTYFNQLRTIKSRLYSEDQT